MNELEIKVIVKSVYGNQQIYPACEKSELFARMVHQKTLTKNDLELIKKLGYQIVVNQPKIEL